MSTVDSPPVTIKTNEAPSHNLKAVSYMSRKETSARENSFKTHTQAGQLAFTAQSGNLSSVLTLSGTVVPLCATIPSSYSFPNHKLFGRLPGSFNRFSMVKTTVGFDKSRNLRVQVEKAIKEHKVFTCVGVYPAVKKALQSRGWVEKNQNLTCNSRFNNFGSSIKDFDGRSFDDESDQAWMNRVLRDYPPDFMWVVRRDNIDWRSMHKDQIINRFPKAFFTTKVGIAACIQNMQWFSETGVSDTFFPRCYRLCMDEEKSSFIDDYRLSACMGLLKWVVNSYEKDGEDGIMDPSSRVVSLSVDFAVRQVNNYVRMRRHEDIDWLMPPSFMGQHWEVFLNQYYSIVHLKSKLAPSDGQDSGKLKYDAAKKALQRMAPLWPQFHIDGINNVWICKPGARSRGKGIIILSQLDKILELLNQNNSREFNWVVQKYIERPLLIYKTKFDIRQWFIVTDWNPLTVWFYKESYIRFCTKPFSLDDFHESIHLCNNAVQCRYQNSELRDSALPDENMWDCYTFQAYLKTLGKMDLWDSLIYPGMKQGILGVLLASQETADVRKNCFELYGADFMLSEDLRPWLIEINSCPCMSPSTSVTARMCAQCLEDCVKVIVDRREDRNAETGYFELAYRQNITTMPPPFNGVDLVVQGKKISKDVDWPSIVNKFNSKRASTGGPSRIMRSTQQPSSMTNGLTFMDLVKRLRVKDAQTNASVVDNSDYNETNNAAMQSNKRVAPVSKSASKIPFHSRNNNQGTVCNKSMECESTLSKNSKQPPNYSINTKINTREELATRLKSTHITSTSERIKPHPPANHKAKLCQQLRVNGSISSEPFHSCRQTNSETLLNTLLKSSLINPTMVDLIRLSQAAAVELPSKIESSTTDKMNVSPEPEQHKEAQRNRSQSLTISCSKWEYEPAGLVNSGKIRPNARTNSYLSFPPPKATDQIRGSPSLLTPSPAKDTELLGMENKNNYSKLASSFYDIHKLNTSQITFDKIENIPFEIRDVDNQETYCTNDINKLNTNGKCRNMFNNSDACIINSNEPQRISMCPDNDDPINSSPTSDPEPHFELKSQGDSEYSEHFPGFSIIEPQHSLKPSAMKQEGSSLSLHHLHHQHPHPCYRVALEHPSSNAALLSSKKYMTSLPLKTINLHMTSVNYPYSSLN